jgi:hypothetical protein
MKPNWDWVFSKNSSRFLLHLGKCFWKCYIVHICPKSLTPNVSKVMLSTRFIIWKSYWKKFSVFLIVCNVFLQWKPFIFKIDLICHILIPHKIQKDHSCHQNDHPIRFLLLSCSGWTLVDEWSSCTNSFIFNQYPLLC